MNDFSTLFEAFQKPFLAGDYPLSIQPLAVVLGLDAKRTLTQLYRKGHLFCLEFCQLDLSGLDGDDPTVRLLRLIQEQSKALDAAMGFLHDYTKLELLQGAANFIEKWNAELKYNGKWAEEHGNADPEYLEAERHLMYSSSYAIQFQELLDRRFEVATESKDREIADNPEAFAKLFSLLEGICNLKDWIELVAFFDWEVRNEPTGELRIGPGKEGKRTILHEDVIASLKSRTLLNLVDHLADKRRLATYLEAFKKPEPAEYWKYVPDKDNPEEMKSFVEGVAIDVRADFYLEREIALLETHYFPGVDEPKHLELADGSLLPLRDTLRVVAFLRAMSEQFIQAVDTEFNDGVDHYSTKFGFSARSMLLQMELKRNKGNRTAVKKALGDLYNEEVLAEQERIIYAAKSKIANANCLAQQPISAIVKFLQWWYQFEEAFILKIIDFFTYDAGNGIGCMAAPFFKIGDRLCWFPTIVRISSFSENLIENLVAQKKLVLHHFQTKVYEEGINQIFKAKGFASLVALPSKEYKTADKSLHGDFDVLAYKNGHLLHFELKLTGVRNHYRERATWRDNQLKHAGQQLGKGRSFIEAHPEAVRALLGLPDEAPINHVDSFILSNSSMFDHQSFGRFMKVSFHDLVAILLGFGPEYFEEADYLRYKVLDILSKNPQLKPPTYFKEWANREISLDMQEYTTYLKSFVKYYDPPLWLTRERTGELVAKYLRENRVYAYLDHMSVKMDDVRAMFGDTVVVVPSFVPQTVFALP